MKWEVEKRVFELISSIFQVNLQKRQFISLRFLEDDELTEAKTIKQVFYKC